MRQPKHGFQPFLLVKSCLKSSSLVLMDPHNAAPVDFVWTAMTNTGAALVQTEILISGATVTVLLTASWKKPQALCRTEAQIVINQHPKSTSQLL